MRTAGIIGLAIACLLLAVACAPAPAKHQRVLLVGIDGASLRIARPMLEAGRLPALAAIASAGVYAPLRAHYPISSPRIWTSMATGMLPERHGITGFARETEAGLTLFGSADRRVPALWNILSEAERSVAVINWWNTHPLEKVRGVVVSDHLLAMDVKGRERMTGAQEGQAGGGGTVAWPEPWNDRVRALLGDDRPLTGVADPFADRDAFPAWVRPERLTKRYENDADVVRVALEVERELHPDVMLVFLPGIDRISHVVWAAVAPENAYKAPPPMTPEQRATIAEALRGYYVYTDALIGLLAERFGAEDLVMVVSDHGFEAGTGMGFLTGGHDSPRSIDGLLFARGPDVGRPPPAQRPRISVNDVTPTVLAWLGLPVARDMDGKPAPFLLGTEPEWIASYADTKVERASAAPTGAETQIIEQLRALGYLEAEAEALPETPEEAGDSH